MNDLTLTEPFLTFRDVAALFPPYRGGRPVHYKTVEDWAGVGVKRADGVRVKLETVKLGGRRLTTRSAVARFIQALQQVEPVPA